MFKTVSLKKEKKMDHWVKMSNYLIKMTVCNAVDTLFQIKENIFKKKRENTVVYVDIFSHIGEIFIRAPI